MSGQEINYILHERSVNLSTLPTIYIKLNEVVSNPHSTIEDVASIISSDQAISAKILQIANSSIYSRHSNRESIIEAVFYLGFREVSNIVFAMSIMSVFKKKEILSYFNPVEFWKHSIAVGVIARQLAASKSVMNLENYFLGGIIHDIGKLFLLEYAEEEFSKALKYSAERKCILETAETEVLGINHVEIGSILARTWNLPENIYNAINCHGYSNRKQDDYSATIHIANIVAKIWLLGNGGDKVIPRINPQAVSQLKIESDIFSQLYPHIIKSYSELLTILLLS
jgi:putative nucleotidyltransferase with HDIG domain